MQTKSLEFLDKIKDLRNLANDVDQKLEQDGVRITNIDKAQVFKYNIPSIISAIEGLLRNEPPERHHLRLKKDFPSFHDHIKALKETPAGRLNAQSLAKLEEIIKFLEENYESL